MKKRRCFGFLAACCLFLAACNEQAVPTQDDYIIAADGITINPVVKEADPETALERIYEGNTVEGVSEASSSILSDRFFIPSNLLEDFHVRYSSGRFGVADVFILKPAPDSSAKVRDLLEQVKLSRIQEFESYDIYNAHQIAQNAQVFEQGGYTVLLMLEDNEKARNIIDRYIPKS